MKSYIEKHRSHSREVVTRALARQVGIEMADLKSPETMPQLINATSFLKKLDLATVRVRAGREVFFGFDLERGANCFSLTERQIGTGSSVDHYYDHHISLHTHPFTDDELGPSDRDQLIGLIPYPYSLDLASMIASNEIGMMVLAHSTWDNYCYLMVVIKTIGYKNHYTEEIFRAEPRPSKSPARITFKDYDRYYSRFGFVTYRGYFLAGQDEPILLRKSLR